MKDNKELKAVLLAEPGRTDQSPSADVHPLYLWITFEEKLEQMKVSYQDLRSFIPDYIRESSTKKLPSTLEAEQNALCQTVSQDVPPQSSLVWRHSRGRRTASSISCCETVRLQARSSSRSSSWWSVSVKLSHTYYRKNQKPSEEPDTSGLKRILRYLRRILPEPRKKFFLEESRKHQQTSTDKGTDVNGSPSAYTIFLIQVFCTLLGLRSLSHFLLFFNLVSISVFYYVHLSSSFVCA